MCSLHGKILKELIRSRWLIFAAFILLIILHHYFVFLGLYDNDDINYARLSALISRGDDLDAYRDFHLTYRWVTIYATALLYKIFGINDFSSSAFTTLCIIATGLFIKKLTDRQPVKIYVLSLVLFFLNYSIIFFSHRLLADPAVCLFGIAAYYFYLKGKEDKYVVMYASASALMLLLMMATKETIILFLPLILVLLIQDIRKRAALKFWSVAAVVTAAGLGGYLLYFHITTGDWLYRYHVVLANAYFNGCSFDILPFSVTLDRITTGLWHSFLLNGDMIYLVTGACGFIFRKKIIPAGNGRNVATAFFVLLMSANFMTISATSYVPLCPDPRHFLFLFPFAAIPGAYMINAYLGEPKKYWLFPAMMLLATLIMFVSDGQEMTYIYLLFTLLLATALLGKINKKAIVAAACLCLLIRPAYDLYRNKYFYLADHRNIVRTFNSSHQAPAYVFTRDTKTAEISEYFLDFREGAVKFRPLWQRNRLRDINDNNSFVLVNAHTLAGIALRPEFRKLEKILQSGPMIIYKTNDPAVFKLVAAYPESP